MVKSYFRKQAGLRETKLKGKVKPNHTDIRFKDLAAIADHMLCTGRLPTVNMIDSNLKTGNTEKMAQSLTLRRAWHNHGQAPKTQITDFRPGVQHLVAEAFEKRVTALAAKLDAQSQKARAEREMLVNANARQAAQIEALVLALADAEVQIADQDKRILRLKKQIALEREAMAGAEQPIRNGRLVPHTRQCST